MNHSENNVTALDLSVLVQSDRLQLLYQQSFPAVFVSMAAAIIFTVTLWPVQDHQLLLAWFSALFLTAMARLILFLQYRKISPEGEEVLIWEKPYFITLMLTSVTWGIGSLFIMPEDSQVHQIVIFSFMIALAGGATSLYSSHSSMTLATVAVILLPVTVYFFMNGGYVYVGMAAAAVLFFISCLRATQFLSQTLNKNFLMTRQLEISNKEAERLARIDDLTGLYNRRAFYEYGALLANNSKRNTDELSMINMDIDNFKLINDTFGHAAGDDVLKQVGQVLLQRLRKSDIYARIGGEEFGMLLPMTSLDQATQLAEQLRQAIEKMSFETGDENFTITASFGVATGSYHVDVLVRRSDQVMYTSKESGRNMVNVYQEDATAL
jgi:diguanylate cyclase (GGDEF)-like protein